MCLFPCPCPPFAISPLLDSSSEPSLTGWPVSVVLQVTLEVVEDPQTEVEMDLLAKPSNHWSQGTPSWLPTRELFWPLFWGYLEGQEGRTGVKGRAPGEEEEEEEEEDYPAEHSENEDQEGRDEDEDDEEEPGFSGATGGWEQGWLAPGAWAFKELDSYGKHPHLGIPGCCPWRSRVEMGVGKSFPGRACWGRQELRPVQTPSSDK